MKFVSLYIVAALLVVEAFAQSRFTEDTEELEESFFEISDETVDDRSLSDEFLEEPTEDCQDLHPKCSIDLCENQYIAGAVCPKTCDTCGKAPTDLSETPTESKETTDENVQPPPPIVASLGEDSDCRKFSLSREAMTFSNAREYCRQEGGWLAKDRLKNMENRFEIQEAVNMCGEKCGYWVDLEKVNDVGWQWSAASDAVPAKLEDIHFWPNHKVLESINIGRKCGFVWSSKPLNGRDDQKESWNMMMFNDRDCTGIDNRALCEFYCD